MGIRIPACSPKREWSESRVVLKREIDGDRGKKKEFGDWLRQGERRGDSTEWREVDSRENEKMESDATR